MALAEVHLEGIYAGVGPCLSRLLDERNASQPVTREDHRGAFDDVRIVGHHRNLTILVQRGCGWVLRPDDGEIVVDDHQLRVDVQHP